MDAEVVLCGRLDAVRAVAEVGDVEVVGQDLILRELALERQCVTGLAQLALDRAVGRRLLLGRSRGRFDQNVLDVLLGQRRATLGDAAGLLVGERRPTGPCSRRRGARRSAGPRWRRSRGASAPGCRRTGPRPGPRCRAGSRAGCRCGRGSRALRQRRDHQLVGRSLKMSALAFAAIPDAADHAAAPARRAAGRRPRQHDDRQQLRRPVVADVLRHTGQCRAGRPCSLVGE